MGSNEKGMKHNNSKILGFGLLALAAVLVLKGKKAPGVGAIGEASKKRNYRSISNWFLKNAPLEYEEGREVRQIRLTTADGRKIKIRNTFFKEVFSKSVSKGIHELEALLATKVLEWAPTMRKTGEEPGKHTNTTFIVYETVYKKYTIEAKTKKHGKEETLYTMRVK